MDLFGILVSMLDLTLWDSYSSFFTSVNKAFGGEHQVIASPSGTFSKISVFTRFRACPLSSCLYFLPRSNPSFGMNRSIHSVLPFFQFFAARFLRLLPRVAGLSWFLVEHVVSSWLVFRVFLLSIPLLSSGFVVAQKFRGLGDGFHRFSLRCPRLSSLPVISCPLR